MTESFERICSMCNTKVEAWIPWRADTSPVLDALATVGSTVDRFACPNCNSTDRERHVKLYLDRIGLMQRLGQCSVLHIAPERRFGELLREIAPARYVRGDLYPTDDTIERIDLQDLEYPGRTFDVVISNHVLEHVSDPRTAIREVHRVLKPGGRYICQTPYAARLSQTFEDPILQTEADRVLFYGQDDHLRLFGLDLERLIVDSGLVGRFVPHAELLPDIDPEQWGINEREPFFDFVRPN